MLKLIPFLLFSVASASADDSNPVVYVKKMPSTQTQNSLVSLDGTAPTGAKWIAVDIWKNSSRIEDTMIPAPSSGHFDVNVSLEDGPGKYDVKLGDITAASPFHSQYYYFEDQPVTNTDTKDESDLLPTPAIESTSPEIQAKAAELIAGKTTELEKFQAIHDWVSQTIQYDTADKPDSRYFDALSTFHMGKAICFGYANLTAALSRAAGLRARVVEGVGIVNGQPAQPDCKTNSDHAWVEAQIHDSSAGGSSRWVTADTTWDAGGVDNHGTFIPGFISTYFDPDPSVFAQDHVRCTIAIDN